MRRNSLNAALARIQELERLLEHERSMNVSPDGGGQDITNWDELSRRVTGRRLWREDELSKLAKPWETATGVYFLFDENRELKYVGQSTNVYNRIGSHYHAAPYWVYVPCDREHLDVLESLYIHFLRPRENGRMYRGPLRGTSEGEMQAPRSLEHLVGLLTKVAKSAGSP